MECGKRTMCRKVLVLMAVFAYLTVTSSAEWPTVNHDLYRTGYSSEYSEFREMDLVMFWNFTVNGSEFTSPVTGDLDGDGNEEIVFGSSEGMVYTLSNKGSILWAYMTSGPIKAAPTIGNLTKGAMKQVVVASTTGDVYGFDYNGTLLWTYRAGGGVVSSPVIHDIVNGPRPGVLFGALDGRLYILHNDGVEYWSYSFGDPVLFSPTMSDIDDNGEEDIILVADDRVNVLSFSPFKIITSSADSVITTNPVIEGNYIVVGTSEGGLYRFEQKTVEVNDTIISSKNLRVYWLNKTKEIEVLEKLAFFNCSEGIYSTPAYVNLNYDELDVNEYVFGCDDKNLYVYLYEENITHLTRYTTSRPVKSSPALVDLNHDGVMEVVFGSNDGLLYVINWTGYTEWVYITGGRVEASPAVSDLDNDDFVELLFASTDGVMHCYGSNTSLKKSVGRNYLRTAYHLLNLGEFDNSTYYGVKALEVYEDMNYTEGIIETNVLFLDVSAKEHCLNAEEYYKWELYDDAIASVEMADFIYFKAGHSIKSECNELLVIAHAKSSYYKSIAALDEGLLSKAEGLANDAKAYSVEAGDSKLTVQSEALYYRIKNIQNAQESFSSLISAYRSDKIPVNLFGKLDIVEDALDSNNATAEIFNVTRKEISVIKGEIYMVNVTRLYNSSQFDRAYELAVKARTLCIEIGNEECVNASETVINKTSSFVEAKYLLQQADKYYRATDFISAADYSRRAMDLFNSSGYPDEALNAADVLNKSSGMLDLTPDSGLMDILSDEIVIIVIVQVIVVLLIITTRPKVKLVFKGFMGYGRSLNAARIGVHAGRGLFR